ncbi:MAG: hypothetical protein IKJ68_09315 [Clostridia bacterium]|nr:hypothetical protein [Clostridia bacterium]
MEFKIPFYNIVNILFSGLVFIGLCVFLIPQKLMLVLNRIQIIPNDVFDLIVMLTLAYEVGLILNWLSSIIVETLLVSRKPREERCWLSRICRITWKSYSDYQKAENAKLNMLTREMNVARNHFFIFVLAGVIALWSHNWMFVIGGFLLAILFYLSYRKHSNKIVSRIENVLRKKVNK